MTVIRALAAALMLLGGGAAMAQSGPSFDEAAFPPEVRESLKYAHDECKDAQEGAKVRFAPDTVRKLDLTGDGRDDYIVSFENTKCGDLEAVYCGTGGCGLDILVALPDGKYRMVFSMRVREYEILPGAKTAPKTIRFALHGGYCGRSGVPSCIKRHKITSRPFEFKEPE
jgi:hypothetical protein